jgi:hypothetical protein
MDITTKIDSFLSEVREVHRDYFAYTEHEESQWKTDAKEFGYTLKNNQNEWEAEYKDRNGNITTVGKFNKSSGGFLNGKYAHD